MCKSSLEFPAHEFRNVSVSNLKLLIRDVSVLLPTDLSYNHIFLSLQNYIRASAENSPEQFIKHNRHFFRFESSTYKLYGSPTS